MARDEEVYDFDPQDRNALSQVVHAVYALATVPRKAMVRLTIKWVRPQRTLAQNDTFHWVYEEWVDLMREQNQPATRDGRAWTHRMAEVFFKWQFLEPELIEYADPRTGEVTVVESEPSSSRLDTQQAGDFFEQMREFIEAKTGYRIPDPDPEKANPRWARRRKRT